MKEAKISSDEGRNRMRAVFLCALLLTGAGCHSTAVQHRPVPAPLTEQAYLPGLPNVRLVIDFTAPNQDIIDAWIKPASAFYIDRPTPITLLDLSGGGADGAFGAGVLCGWTKTGTRPNFDIVAGISTGALMAPLAFLGPAYDDDLKSAYTTISDKDIFKRRNWLVVLLKRDSLADTSPLFNTLLKRFDQAKINAIAAEHRKGRRLYVATTDLDAQVTVVWDLGALAASGHPRTREIFCHILMASASVPAAFPPVFFDVVANGERFDEMHVDGGIMMQVGGLIFLERLMKLSNQSKAQMVVLRNGKIASEWKDVRPTSTAITARAIDTLIKTQGIGDLDRAYLVALTTGIGFTFAAIPGEFAYTPRKGMVVDPVYMNKLFATGFNGARNGTIWKKELRGVKMLNTGINERTGAEAPKKAAETRLPATSPPTAK